MRTLVKLEILRTLRNKRYAFFTVLYPALLYFFFININHSMPDGLDAKTYFMVSMATFGAVGAVLTGSAQRISLERKSGWTRQLRLTALPGRAYATAKICASAVTTLPSILVLFALGAAEGVQLDAGQWLGLVLVLWAGSFVFAALGVALGYAAEPNAVQPIVMIIYMVLSVLGGTWYPITGGLKSIARFDPVYLYNRLAVFVHPGASFDTAAAAGLAGFLAVFVAAAAFLYRRDTQQA
ncbi:ABC transporter [Streptomyces tateyamensis]|uniref:ABC transporter n=1 Tax=Streptomyces tateyamensis TaxID=565073 RepID=A0A2V4N2W6_9ACTN|nr:ABC transporter permease [Streptomyces tateyamensis]PYC72121.1 ABC transporter [Streptomyces tateyamensis]